MAIRKSRPSKEHHGHQTRARTCHLEHPNTLRYLTRPRAVYAASFKPPPARACPLSPPTKV
ncbi:uncharacterized protein BBA_01126 [Beauveria bassiana ARSEF 2860]|uniref:Uncharacterized protein n=1 Tax=Beauveria bassiana (strain ARSEF 2860) TaxID=655819 RepID=J4UVR2_BEAB2|nr:uncharacterized protein BBA_01126 [Beauveria bassiana ARSEF 2860]EJP70257.1 hypothetical protein BBA_01126 [Beauveria bassiana ARSEF 2860]